MKLNTMILQYLRWHYWTGYSWEKKKNNVVEKPLEKMKVYKGTKSE